MSFFHLNFVVGHFDKSAEKIMFIGTDTNMGQ